ncbi:Cytochrome c A [Bhargavaea cecembensis DSE10]|uniref:Cytochrome c A n=1 Tax=Bhargavaea cecembensis DSE10 TaxID=1235279 RepID=M7NFE7_9BACL|nr:cytochrome c [Bhargavaea cecembensis]EMR05916.1 Cytochrome c A [Bhargavaea cecembensis DSE10]
MNRNPVVPYILIMALGIGLIFFMSLYGLDNQEEIAADQEQSEDSGGDTTTGEAGGEGGDEASSGDFDPEALAQGKCVSCHGQNYEGSVGPSLVGLDSSADEVKDVLKNGKGAMPGGLVPDENLDAMAEWVLSLQ